MARPTGGSTKTTISGTRGDDTITVVSGGVTINGTFQAITQSKIDAGLIIKGGDGKDVITGGPGSDTLDGGNGNDTLRDTIDTVFIGGSGIDTVDLSGSTTGVAIDLQGNGTVFQDSIIYDQGDGYLGGLFGGPVNGTLQGIENFTGTSGNDWIMGNSAANVLRGGPGNDIVTAMSLNDTAIDKLYGGVGNDNLFAGGGNDVLTGGSGRDIFGFDPDRYDGNWVVTDYTSGADRVVLFPYSGTVTWGTDGAGNVVAYMETDSITFLGVTEYTAIDLVITRDWPPYDVSFG